MNTPIKNIQDMLAPLPPFQLSEIEAQVAVHYRTFVRNQLDRLDASRLIRVNRFITTVINPPIDEDYYYEEEPEPQPQAQAAAPEEDEDEEEAQAAAPQDEEEGDEMLTDVDLPEEEGEEMLTDVDSPEDEEEDQEMLTEVDSPEEDEMSYRGCPACREQQPGQMAHMQPGGCLDYESDYLEEYDDEEPEPEPQPREHGEYNGMNCPMCKKMAQPGCCPYNNIYSIFFTREQINRALNSS